MIQKLEDYSIDEEAFNLKDMMDNVLGVLVAVYEQYNVPLPARRYWTTGMASVDCAQAVVSLIQLYLGPPGDQAATPQHCNQPKTAVLTIYISREVPVPSNNGKPPAPEDIQAAAGWQATDAWVLMESLEQFDTWGIDGIRGPGVIATIQTPAPMGGFATVEMQLTVTVP